jgi:hypothetical protein
MPNITLQKIVEEVGERMAKKVYLSRRLIKILGE